MANIHPRISAPGSRSTDAAAAYESNQLDDPVAMMRGALEMAAAVKAGVTF